jgi:MFS transporter, Spinster family, sphingosine-1-phosphate transporter
MKENIYKKYLLTILLVVLAFNFVDRLALGLVMQDIKSDLNLSDTQLGLLTGFAFAVFYSVMGIPIARWADRGNRVTIIALTTALWSVMVALCGAATSFVHLLLIRIGIAVGEAGAVPPAHSLIADHFERAERPRAMGIYMLGIPLSAFIGYFGAGWLNELFGWRMMFVILGLPGVLLAALACFTLREPRRTRTVPVEMTQQPSMKEVFVTLWAIPTFRHMLLVFSVLFFFNTGITQWLPTFFIRSHGFETGQLGIWFTLAFGVSGFIGIYSGGAIASRYLPNNERLQLKVVAILFLAMLIVRPISFLVPSALWAFALMVPAAFVVYIADGPLFAIVQSLVPDRMRAMSIALIYLCANLIGLGLGPLVVGALSDAYRPWAGEDSLRYALVTLCPGYLWVIWQLWRASDTVTHDLDVARAGRAVAVREEVETKLAQAEAGR